MIGNPHGRDKAAPRYFPTLHAYAAAQAVLAPLLAVKQARFPPDPVTVGVVRQLWHGRARELAAAGYGPLQHPGALERALSCPHALLAPDPLAKEGRPCHLDRACPFCRGLTAALTFENVLRALQRHPRARLLFLGRSPRDAAPLPGECGRVWHRGKALVAVEGPPGVLRPHARARPVPPGSLAVARAVAWVERYPYKVLLRPVGWVLKGLDRERGLRLSRTTGIFRSPHSARQIGQCRTDLIAPVVARHPGLPGFLLHEAEVLASLLPASFDHEGFARCNLEAALGGVPYQLSWGGVFPFPALAAVSNTRWKTFQPLFRRWRPGTEGVLSAVPPMGYMVFRGWSGRDDLFHDPDFHGPADCRIGVRIRRKCYIWEQMAFWAWHKAHPLGGPLGQAG